MNDGKVTNKYEVRLLASGQPRAYADSIYHARITHTVVDWLGDEKPWKPVWKKEEAPDKYQDQIDNEIDVALRMIGLSNNRKFKSDVNMNSAEEYFAGWIEYAVYIEDGVVEIMTVHPFAD